jgi:molybdopterin synthase sulfur carrier subunit
MFVTVAIVRLFASAREAAGTGRDVIDADDVAGLLAVARIRYGGRFEDLLASCRIWVNGEPADPDTPVSAADEVAILPPVSGG